MMKHVNFDPAMQKKSDEVMEQLTGGQTGDPADIKADSEAAKAPTAPLDDSTLTANVIDALKEIYDPEIPLNIYDLGLIYKVALQDGFAEVDMTLTTPGCPVAQSFPGLVENSVKKVAGVTDAKVNLVWDPPWTQEMLTDEARLQLGLI